MRREEAEELGTLETMRKLDGVQLQPLGVVEASSFLAALSMVVTFTSWGMKYKLCNYGDIHYNKNTNCTAVERHHRTGWMMLFKKGGLKKRHTQLVIVRRACDI
jgi:hypothetical protein